MTVQRAMLYFVLRKLGKLLTLLIAVSALSFTLVYFSPVDPVQSYIGADATRVSPEQRDAIAAYWGADEGPATQYVTWAGNVLQGDLGTSLIYRESVSTIIAERFLASLLLMATAWILSGVFGYVLGVIAGAYKGTLADKVIKAYCFLLASTPGFWLGLILLMVFAVQLGWFPVGLGTPAGLLAEEVTWLDRLAHVFLPALTLSIIGVANIALHTREKLIDALESEYVRYAKTKGEKGWTLIRRQTLRGISLPAISLHFASFGELFGGAVLAEQVFSYPGLGQAVVEAGLGGDIPLLLGIVLFTTVFVFTGNTIADILYKVVDPRIREGDVK